MSSMKVEASIMKEKLEGLQHVEGMDNSINISSYYTLLDGAASQQDKRSTVGELLKANAKQLYRYFAPLISSKNNEVRELRRELVENKQ